MLEHYPVLVLDASGHLDLEHQQAQLRAEVDDLEAVGYAPMPRTAEPHEAATDWRPDPTTRRRLLALIAPATSYRSRIARGTLPSQAEERRPRVTYHVRRRWTRTQGLASQCEAA